MAMEYFTIKDAATTLEITERWLQMLCKQGKIPGATRVNNQGAWLIPAIWVKTEQEKRFSGTEKKEKCNMKKIALVFDDVSEEIGKNILSDFEQKEMMFYSNGIIPIYAHAEEDVIMSSLYEIIHGCDMVIGISSSGNGIAIYTNKISGFTAVPIVSIDDIDEAIDIYAANAFDIPAHHKDIISICTNLIKRTEK